MDGVITSIQRFSLNDGPGIRTTVFFKGCNLRCAWCHNPETFALADDMMVDASKCIGCLHCVEVCPSGAQREIDGKHAFQRDLCTRCGACADVCFPGALEHTAKVMTCDDVMREILQDKAYYLDSGGGVTLSGGEAMLQADFAAEITAACHENGIECAVETNLAYELDPCEAVLRGFDLIMFDIKQMDSAQHKRWTGAGNETILANAQRVDGFGRPMIARVPLIPGATDDMANLAATVAFLATLKNLRYLEILNFNPLGEAKYRCLSLDNPFVTARPYSDQQMGDFQRALSDRGVDVRVG